MDGWTDDGKMERWMDGQMNGWVDGWIDRLIYIYELRNWWMKQAIKL